MCANVSPVEIKLTQTNNIEFKASSQTRTRDLKNFQKMEECYKNLQFEGKSLTIGSRYYPWDSTSKPNLVNITNKAYEDLGVKVKLVTSTGGVEPSWWQLCNPNLNCAGVGATIVDAHGMTETLYLNTIQPVLDCIKKVMLAMETAQ